MSIQGSVNQLLGIGAAVASYGTKVASEAYAQKRGAEYQNAYQAQKEAIASKYTKSGALSKSKKAQETALKAQQAQPGAGSKAPWNKGVEAKLKAEFDTKMQDLSKAEAKGLKQLKDTTAKAKEQTAKQFGNLQELSPKLLSMMSAEDRWKIKATEKIMQKDAYQKFMDSIMKQGEKK